MSNVKVTRWFVIIFLLAIIVAFLFFGALCTNQTMKIFFVGNAFKDLKEDIYNKENEKVAEKFFAGMGDSVVVPHVQKDLVVFLGDSITEMYDVKKYYKHSGFNVVNRGISSETTEEVLDRLTLNVMSIAPEKVVVLIGTNDLNKGSTPDEIVDNIIKIAKNIRYFNEETEIYIESILPVNNSAYLLSKSIVNKRLNSDIDYINSQLRDNARFYHYTFVDTATPLKDGEVLKKEYSVDGLHISRQGYSVMTETILAALKA